MEREELVLAVKAAADGDEQAWERLVAAFTGLVWAIARSHRLDQADAADVVQVTWLRLLEHLGRIREPERVGAWIATTARRECLRLLRARSRELPSEAYADPVDPGHSPEDAALVAERDELLRRALDASSPRCRRLLRLLAAAPPPSYAEVSAALGMPIGSIGPTRARCLSCLRRHAQALGLEAPALAPA